MERTTVNTTSSSTFNSSSTATSTSTSSTAFSATSTAFSSTSYQTSMASTNTISVHSKAKTAPFHQTTASTSFKSSFELPNKTPNRSSASSFAKCHFVSTNATKIISNPVTTSTSSAIQQAYSSNIMSSNTSRFGFKQVHDKTIKNDSKHTRTLTIYSNQDSRSSDNALKPTQEGSDPYYFRPPEWVWNFSKSLLDLRSSLAIVPDKFIKNINPEKKYDYTESERVRRSRAIKRRRITAWLNRPKPSQFNLNSDDKAIIGKQVEFFQKSNVKVVILDCEMYVAKQDEITRKHKNLCLWIAIADETCTLMYESFAKPPRNNIHNLGTRFHGLEWTDIKFARHLPMLRQQVIDFCMQANYIVGFNIMSDLKSLDFQPSEIAVFSNKIVDLAHCLSPRRNSPLALRFIAYLSLGVASLQQGSHSPVDDTVVTAWLFAKYYNQIMAKRENELDLSPNLEIAELLDNFTRANRKWPRSLLQGVKNPPAYDDTCY